MHPEKAEDPRLPVKLDGMVNVVNESQLRKALPPIAVCEPLADGQVILVTPVLLNALLPIDKVPVTPEKFKVNPLLQDWKALVLIVIFPVTLLN